MDKRYKHSGPSRRFRRGQMTTMWVRTKHLRCRCPKIRPDSSYLVLDTEGQSPEDAAGDRRRSGLVVKRKTLVLQWKREWKRRMKRFKKRARKAC